MIGLYLGEGTTFSRSSRARISLDTIPGQGENRVGVAGARKISRPDLSRPLTSAIKTRLGDGGRYVVAAQGAVGNEVFSHNLEQGSISPV